MSSPEQTKAIRDLNDVFRQTFKGGTVMLTSGMIELGTETQAKVFAAIQTFDAFEDGNDPWGEHDFGSVEVDGERVFFKTDYYDLTRAMHSVDPADPSVTERVMTIMLASEY
jgi:hypothetical protein